ncbi:hypothetical protein LJC63_03740 [Ruminococcaceae bacterium OttesenSCG-928-L11]|nr:hypothetical protein [Ruminococcaceae bacterium OttesenSCG-928-L11]
MKHTHTEGRGIFSADWLMDRETDAMLLPRACRGADNSRRRSHCRKAIRLAMETALSPQQRQRVEQYYFEGLPMAEIARREQISSHAVSKTLQNAEKAIRKYGMAYMKIYDEVEKEFLNEYEN